MSAYIMREYDAALYRILKEGVVKKNRTGVETKAIFGIQSRYQISEHFPIITGRKLKYTAPFCELLWFVSGSTNNNDLIRLGAKFWTPWVSEQFGKEHGYAPGCLGPIYGFQLRHFGGDYCDGDAKRSMYWDKKRHGYTHYGNGGFDQLAYMVHLLKTDPDNRRILFDLWSPKELDKMRLPPCHYTYQVFVHDGKLSGHLTQRSCDFPVGVPANIQFYSALTYMLAQQCGFEPWEFVHETVDSHIYIDQIPAVEEYLSRSKPPSPKLKLNKAADIYSYKPEDFVIEDYNPLPAMKVPVAV